MANYTVNDKGQRVIAVGAPGSMARARVERPALIEAMKEAPVKQWEGMARRAGATGLELYSIIGVVGTETATN